MIVTTLGYVSAAIGSTLIVAAMALSSYLLVQAAGRARAMRDIDALAVAGEHKQHAMASMSRSEFLRLRVTPRELRQEYGLWVQSRPLLLYGWPPSSKRCGGSLLWDGSVSYQWVSVRAWGPFLLRTSVGPRLDVLYHNPVAIPCRAAIEVSWCSIGLKGR